MKICVNSQGGTSGEAEYPALDGALDGTDRRSGKAEYPALDGALDGTESIKRVSTLVRQRRRYPIRQIAHPFSLY